MDRLPLRRLRLPSLWSAGVVRTSAPKDRLRTGTCAPAAKTLARPTLSDPSRSGSARALSIGFSAALRWREEAGDGLPECFLPRWPSDGPSRLGAFNIGCSPKLGGRGPIA